MDSITARTTSQQVRKVTLQSNTARKKPSRKTRKKRRRQARRAKRNAAAVEAINLTAEEELSLPGTGRMEVIRPSDSYITPIVPPKYSYQANGNALHSDKKGKRSEKDARRSEDNLIERARNNWTKNLDQRRFLFFVKRFYNSSLEEVTQLFDKAFTEDLKECGLPDGLWQKTIEAQIRDVKTLRRQEVVTVLDDTPFTQLAIVYESVNNLVVKAARSLNINLERRTIDEWKPTGVIPAHKRKRACTVFSDVSEDMSNVGSDSDDNDTQRAVKRCRADLTKIPEKTQQLVPKRSSAINSQTIREDTQRSLLPALEITPRGPTLQPDSIPTPPDSSFASRRFEDTLGGVPSHGGF